MFAASKSCAHPHGTTPLPKERGLAHCHRLIHKPGGLGRTSFFNMELWGCGHTTWCNAHLDALAWRGWEDGGGGGGGGI